ncbi:phosphoglycolate phosphatase [Roseivivax sp. THAF30]|uniref:phosphoglycolate phosphatase n=1 Tax=Roseivivax sp. THAF30 TaxID=2587852 RepID=UPI00126942A1|nr:phosphoglycolate phosphatase [Roseivivax sp. THAF30]QFT62140.1 Phosphoglycolate phosphatase, chromosomal [Roseivivax sp. THAF30]
MRIVFDLDGTLIDSAPEIRGIANALLAEDARAPLTLEETKSFIGNGAPTFIARMRAAREIPGEAQGRLLHAFEARYETAFGLTTLYPGVRGALEALRREGHVLAICTNKPIRPTLAVLAHLGLETYFDTVVGGDSLPVRKPDPEPLRAATLGEPAVYVGDSEVDAETAARAGVPFLFFTEGYCHIPHEKITAAASFPDFKDLPQLVSAFA